MIDVIRTSARLTSIGFFAAVSLMGCGREEMPDIEDIRAIDRTPSAELILDGGAREEIRTELLAGEILLIRNDDDERHRLRGDHFDSGWMLPGDETLVQFVEPRMVEWEDEVGDLRGTVTIELQQ